MTTYVDIKYLVTPIGRAPEYPARATSEPRFPTIDVF
jgi:hypothetical protein